MANTSIFAAFERMWHHVTLAINDARSSLQTQINNLSAVGKAIANRGEIFNDYENNYAVGLHSHAEGNNNEAYGDYSHVEGIGNEASGEAQHVSGKYCDPDNTKAVIIGNGKSIFVHQNAYTLDWDGNGWFAGTITVGDNNTPVLLQGETGGWGTKALQIPAVNSVDEIEASGLYELSSPIGGMMITSGAGGGCLQVENTDLWGRFYTFKSDLGYILYNRKQNNGTLGEWEWLNPPLRPNIEYRTTERYNGQAVYKKMDDNGIILWRSADETEWRNPQQEMINAVLAALPTWEGGSY